MIDKSPNRPIQDDTWAFDGAPDPVSAAAAWQVQQAKIHQGKSPERVLMEIHGIGREQAETLVKAVTEKPCAPCAAARAALKFLWPK